MDTTLSYNPSNIYLIANSFLTMLCYTDVYSQQKQNSQLVNNIFDPSTALHFGG